MALRIWLVLCVHLWLFPLAIVRGQQSSDAASPSVRAAFPFPFAGLARTLQEDGEDDEDGSASAGGQKLAEGSGYKFLNGRDDCPDCEEDRGALVAIAQALGIPRPQEDKSICEQADLGWAFCIRWDEDGDDNPKEGLMLTFRRGYGTIVKGFDDKPATCGVDEAQIPPELFSLKTIMALFIENCDFVGEIPPEIGNLTHMRWLYLSLLGKLKGEMPPAITKLTELRGLILRNLRIRWRLPDDFGTKLPELRRLEAFQCPYLEGGLPESIGLLSKLNLLVLAHLTSFDGPLPRSFGNMTSLERVSISWTPITGTLDPSIGSLQKLATLRLKYTMISGPLPLLESQLPKLRTLDLEGNQLSGNLPLLSQSPDLKTVKLQGNRNLTGRIPPEWKNLTSLGIIELQDTSLEGSIPEALCEIKSLYDLNIARAGLKGSIPECLGDLANLTTLDLSGNELTGRIPATLGKLQSLWSLKLANNQLKDSIPSSLGNLTALEELDLRGNHLDGAVPPLTNLTNLRYLDVSANKLEEFDGELPAGELREVSASHNSLKEFPRSWRSLGSVQHLKLDHNRIKEWVTWGRHPTDWFVNGEFVVTQLANLRVMLESMDQGPSWDELVSVDISGNPALKADVNAFLLPFSYAQNLRILQASNCGLTGTLVEGGLWAIDKDEDGVPKHRLGFQQLSHLDLSSNKIRAVELPHVVSLNALTTVSLRGNALVHLAPPPRPSAPPGTPSFGIPIPFAGAALQDYSDNPNLRVGGIRRPREKCSKVMSESATFSLRLMETRQLSRRIFGRRELQSPLNNTTIAAHALTPLSANPDGYMPLDTAVECTRLCSSPLRTIRIDPFVSPEALCRCRGGYQGTGNQCDECPVDTFSDPDNTFSDPPRVGACTACPENSSTEGSVRPYDGRDACKCRPGYEPVGSKCTPCKPGYAKWKAGNTPCVSCAEWEADNESNRQCCPSRYRLYHDVASASCRACPRGANCTSPNVTDAFTLPGYWPLTPRSALLDLDTPLSVIRCPFPRSCIAPDVCAEGYGGFACASCSKGWYRDVMRGQLGGPDDGCLECERAWDGVGAALVVVIVGVVVWLLVTVGKRASRWYDQRGSHAVAFIATLRIIANHSFVMGLVTWAVLERDGRAGPDSIVPFWSKEALRGLMGWTGGPPLDALRIHIECLFPVANSPLAYAILWVFLPPILALLYSTIITAPQLKSCLRPAQRGREDENSVTTKKDDGDGDGEGDGEVSAKEMKAPGEESKTTATPTFSPAQVTLATAAETAETPKSRSSGERWDPLKEWVARCKPVWVAVMWVLFPSVLMNLTPLLRCIAFQPTDPNAPWPSPRLMVAPDIACGSLEHLPWLLAGLLGIGIWAVGWLTWGCWTLHQASVAREMHRPELRKAWGLMYLGYRARYWGWECAIKARNLLVIAVTLIPAGLFHDSTVLWVWAAVAILNLSYHWARRPLETPFLPQEKTLQRLQGSAIALWVIALCPALMLTNPSSSAGAVGFAVGVAVVNLLFVTGLLMFAAFQLLMLFASYKAGGSGSKVGRWAWRFSSTPRQSTPQLETGVTLDPESLDLLVMDLRECDEGAKAETQPQAEHDATPPNETTIAAARGRSISRLFRRRKGGSRSSVRDRRKVSAQTQQLMRLAGRLISELGESNPSGRIPAGLLSTLWQRIFDDNKGEEDSGRSREALRHQSTGGDSVSASPSRRNRFGMVRMPSGKEPSDTPMAEASTSPDRREVARRQGTSSTPLLPNMSPSSTVYRQFVRDISTTTTTGQPANKSAPSTLFREEGEVPADDRRLSQSTPITPTSVAGSRCSMSPVNLTADGGLRKSPTPPLQPTGQQDVAGDLAGAATLPPRACKEFRQLTLDFRSVAHQYLMSTLEAQKQQTAVMIDTQKAVQAMAPDAPIIITTEKADADAGCRTSVSVQTQQPGRSGGLAEEQPPQPPPAPPPAAEPSSTSSSTSTARPSPPSRLSSVPSIDSASASPESPISREDGPSRRSSLSTVAVLESSAGPTSAQGVAPPASPARSNKGIRVRKSRSGHFRVRKRDKPARMTSPRQAQVQASRGWEDGVGGILRGGEEWSIYTGADSSEGGESPQAAGAAPLSPSSESASSLASTGSMPASLRRRPSSCASVVVHETIFEDREEEEKAEKEEELERRQSGTQSTLGHGMSNETVVAESTPVVAQLLEAPSCSPTDSMSGMSERDFPRGGRRQPVAEPVAAPSQSDGEEDRPTTPPVSLASSGTRRKSRRRSPDEDLSPSCGHDVPAQPPRPPTRGSSAASMSRSSTPPEGPGQGPGDSYTPAHMWGGGGGGYPFPPPMPYGYQAGGFSPYAYPPGPYHQQTHPGMPPYWAPQYPPSGYGPPAGSQRKKKGSRRKSDAREGGEERGGRQQQQQQPQPPSMGYPPSHHPYMYPPPSYGYGWPPPYPSYFDGPGMPTFGSDDAADEPPPVKRRATPPASKKAGRCISSVDETSAGGGGGGWERRTAGPPAIRTDEVTDPEPPSRQSSVSVSVTSPAVPMATSDPTLPSSASQHQHQQQPPPTALHRSATADGTGSGSSKANRGVGVERSKHERGSAPMPSPHPPPPSPHYPYPPYPPYYGMYQPPPPPPHMMYGAAAAAAGGAGADGYGGDEYESDGPEEDADSDVGSGQE
ncbi:unnamed protein product [Vitrella brassicaformis CCMP3155]|uniref:EGF-like domain-containing protein n=4 Tax=Vitrella brassicaformis TaxID=1169539 RepID=A0A0G4H7D4_VITBC|nr:unnamed protein product [Vitrella brassicaformis CCMP3155]|eukprot:CEM39805.1 unnamed protein product [Vitrella brassicaformis CCMP3155]